MKEIEYRLYRSSDAKIIYPQVHYVPNSESIPFYATIAEAIDININSTKVTAEGQINQVLLDFSDYRYRQ